MTKEQIFIIEKMRSAGDGCRAISDALNIPFNSVKSWCHRHPPENRCRHCGAPLQTVPHRKEKKFCSDRCRFAWWSAHPEKRNPKTLYDHVCPGCGSPFTSPRKNTRFCSSACYAASRKGVHRED